MSHKTFPFVAGLISLLVAVIDPWRLAHGWYVTFSGWTVPLWVSWVALVIAEFLAYGVLRLSGHRWRI